MGYALALSLSVGALYGLLWLIDFGGVPGAGPFTLFTEVGAVSTLTNLGEVTVATVGFAVTVVAIIVELAANRYTPRITELFLRDPVNRIVLSFFVLSAVMVLWVAMSLFGPHHPRVMVITAMGLLSASLIGLLPYFVYVFDFLSPTRVVGHIKRRSLHGLRLARRGRRLDEARAELMDGIEQLGELALVCVENRDKAIAISAVSALAEISEAAVHQKGEMPSGWWDSREFIAHDQDFIAMHPEVLEALIRQKVWVEMKVLRQYQAVFSESTRKMRDVNHFVAILTRQIATRDAEHGDGDSLRLSIRFFHTFMRSTINAKDVRTCYHLLNEYRALAEDLLRLGVRETVLEMAERFKYYGQAAFHGKLPFILETAAYDLAGVVELAYTQGVDYHQQLLDVLLDIDHEPDEEVLMQEASLRGVRKAQVKLATFYLIHDEREHALRVFHDMQGEKRERLVSIFQELRGVDEAEYWEVTDRGINFDYLPPDQRAQLDVFFGWFESL